MQVPMTKPQIQYLIARNKQMITALEKTRKALENAVQVCWKGADPMKDTVDSQSAFSSLNAFKDDLRKVQKEIKKLSDIQKALKITIGNNLY